jgi:hypothetical protein
MPILLYLDDDIGAIHGALGAIGFDGVGGGGAAIDRGHLLQFCEQLTPGMFAARAGEFDAFVHRFFFHQLFISD